MKLRILIGRARPSLVLPLLLLISLLPLALHAAAAQEPEQYRTPPAEIVGILDAEPPPLVRVSPDGEYLVFLHRESLPPVAELAQPMLRLAGQRINPDTNARHGPRSVVGLSIKNIATGEERVLDLPDDVGVSLESWSPDGQRLAFTMIGADGVSLWLADIEAAEARPLTGAVINALGPGARFMPDGRHIIASLIPEDRGDAPEASLVPPGPNVQESRRGEPAPVRTYQDLLTSAHDEALFEHYFTSQIVLIDVESGERAETPAASRALGPAAIYTGIQPSPTGRHFIASRIEAPYSRAVPMGRFARAVELWDVEGEVVRELVRTPIADRIPIGGVITEPRGHRWRATADTEEVLWSEALDGGDPRAEVDHRDRIVLLEAPFEDEPRELFRTAGRFSGITWLADSDQALIRDYERNTRWTITTHVDAADPDAAPRTIWSRNVHDRYADAGSPVTAVNSAGRRVALFPDGNLLLTGTGATPEGNRPFIDRFNLESLESERLWRNEDESYEYVVDVVCERATQILTRRETPIEPPNYYLRDLAAGNNRALTAFAHPAPQLIDVHKEMVRYTREDGVELTATLYLPPDYREGDRLPLVVWAYPREFSDPDTAGQVAGSPYRFTMFRGSSHLFMLLQGYAILDGAAMPVVGSDPDTVNDTFVEQIVASARAAIDFADEIGVADRDRVGVGGHSYGAFMTANLLAHSDLFRAGIARSGAYNRTLTPFGFQAERRTLWEAPEVYFELSPFMHADKIAAPVLLLHGEVDNNSGTFPMQSERMYHAIKGHGGTARLVMMPHEGHGYRARESVLHVLAEMIEWFDEHVKYVEP